MLRYDIMKSKLDLVEMIR